MWRKQGKRLWQHDNGMIITNESFTCGGILVKYYALFKNQADRYKGITLANGESFHEVKTKAGQL